MAHDPIILPHGGYKSLLTYKKSIIILEGTICYCRRFLRLSDRTVDQMTQAARSCKQNIVEGSEAAATSKKTELHLTNVARASLEELLEDYRDQLRSHQLAPWNLDEKRTKRVRDYCAAHSDWTEYEKIFESRSLEELCNLQICQIFQEQRLLKKQIAYLAEDFKKHGGLSERMSAVRYGERSDGWAEKIYDYLHAAESPSDLTARTSEVIQRVKACQALSAKHHGWSH